MRAYDFTITAPHATGTIAKLAEELGREKINIEGLFAVDHDGKPVFHLLTTDKTGTKRAVDKVGYTVSQEREVVVERVEDRPGVLGEITRKIADADINLTTAYLATDSRLVLGCEKLADLETAWKKAMPTGAAR